jgi:predicted adenine nucleotide alpha hydrolase (AANH) superfamily ATPase
MKLLIHTCCADCALKMIKALKITEPVALYFYNPNIHPQEEYYARLRALKLVFGKQTGVRLIIPHWSPKEYFAQIKRLLETHREINDRTIRCPECWRLRLETTCKYAKEEGYEAVTSTMLTSQYLNKEKIVGLGSALAQEYGLKFVRPANNEVFEPTKGFYKQNYCGCVLSLMERMAEKYQLR